MSNVHTVDGVHEILMRQLPDWFKPVLEYIAIMQGYAVELSGYEQTAQQIEQNFFIQTCDLATIQMWERLLHLSVRYGDTIDFRRERIIQKLAQIAVTSARTVAALTGWEPRVAMLSYSTDGSSEGELVQKVRDAVAAAHELAPELKIDGEFQLDAAIRPDVAAKKVHRPSEVVGRANVIVWPDINVGNIGVKLVQNFAHANAYGPFLQGFKKVVCDCSRSSPVPELVGNVVMSCVRAQALKED